MPKNKNTQADSVIRGRSLKDQHLLDYDGDGGKRLWFHNVCWKTWHMARRAEAAAALTAIGIPLPAKRLWRQERIEQ
jgi:hypothetical protein